MKKLFWIFVAVASITFCACGGNTKTGTANDSDSVAVDSLDTTVVVDSVVADTVVK